MSKKSQTCAEAMAEMKQRWYEKHTGTKPPPPPKPKPPTKAEKEAKARAKAYRDLKKPQPIVVKQAGKVEVVDPAVFTPPPHRPLPLTTAQRRALLADVHPRLAFPRFTPAERNPERRLELEADQRLAANNASCPLCAKRIAAGEDNIVDIDGVGAVHVRCGERFHPCPASIGEVHELTSLFKLIVTGIKEVKRDERVKGGEAKRKGGPRKIDEWEIEYQTRSEQSNFLGSAGGYSTSMAGAMKVKQMPLPWQSEPEREPEAITRKELTEMKNRTVTETVEAHIKAKEVSLKMTEETLEVMENGDATSEETWGVRQSIEKQKQILNRERAKLPASKAA